MHDHLADRHLGQAGRLGDLGKPVEPLLVLAVVDRRNTEIAVPGEAAGDAPQIAPEAAALEQVGRQSDQDKPPAPLFQIRHAEMTLTLRCTALAEREKPGQPGPGGKIGRKRQPFDRAVG